MNLTPKKDFLEQKQLATVHRDLVVSTPFRTAINAALIEYVISLPDTGDSAACFNKIVGARDFVQHLLNIAEHPKTPTPPTSANLDHRVR